LVLSPSAVLFYSLGPNCGGNLVGLCEETCEVAEWRFIQKNKKKLLNGIWF